MHFRAYLGGCPKCNLCVEIQPYYQLNFKVRHIVSIICSSIKSQSVLWISIQHLKSNLNNLDNKRLIHGWHLLIFYSKIICCLHQKSAFAIKSIGKRWLDKYLSRLDKYTIESFLPALHTLHIFFFYSSWQICFRFFRLIKSLLLIVFFNLCHKFSVGSRSWLWF